MRGRILQWAWALLMAGAVSASAQVSDVAGPRTVPETEKAARFLTRLRVADPDYRFVLMACLKERELNLLFSRHVTEEEVPVLTQGLLTQLVKELPGKDLTVVSFRPVVPLREAARAYFDSSTGTITYTPGPN